MKREYDSVSTREAFGRAVLECMRGDPEMLAIAPDTGKSMGFDEAAQCFPDRVINNGIAEQNMVDMAAGIASTGRRVMIGTYAPFLALRALEQIRTFICYPKLPIVMGGAMAGLAGGIEGPTHQCTEDIGIMRMLPHMRTIVPADAQAALELTKEAVRQNAPAYIRLGRYRMPSVYGKDERFEIGKAKVLRSGRDAALLCCGSMVSRGLEAAESLAEHGIDIQVIDMHTVKPLDEEAVLHAAASTGVIVTAEEHFRTGGLGAAVAELLAEKCPTRMVRVGIADTFAESADQETLMDAYGLSVADVAEAVRAAIKRKER